MSVFVRSGIVSGCIRPRHGICHSREFDPPPRPIWTMLPVWIAPNPGHTVRRNGENVLPCARRADSVEERRFVCGLVTFRQLVSRPSNPRRRHTAKGERASQSELARPWLFSGRFVRGDSVV